MSLEQTWSLAALEAALCRTPLPPEARMRVSSLADVGVDPHVNPHAVAALAVPEPSCHHRRYSQHAFDAKSHSEVSGIRILRPLHSGQVKGAQENAMC